MMNDFSFEMFKKFLETRTLTRLRSFHFLKDGEIYRCLDLSLESPDLEHLKNLVIQWVESHEVTEILPAAPESEWRKLADVSDPRNELGSSAIFTKCKFHLAANGHHYLVIMEDAAS